MSLIDTIFGSYTKRNKNKIKSIVNNVNSRKNITSKMTSKDFLDKTNEFRKRLREGESINSIMIEALAVCREATKRVTRKEPYDVQIEAAAAMNEGIIAEMKTGEGKSLVQILIAYLNALEATKSLNKNEWTSVHVMTSNDALAERDANDNKEVFKLLGLTSSFVTRDFDVSSAKNPKEVIELRNKFRKQKQLAYNSDIIYATPRTIAFDYLDDNTAFKKEDKNMRRKFGYAVIDEADDILFDQANNPLILSASSLNATDPEMRIEEERIRSYYIEASKLLNGYQSSMIKGLNRPLVGSMIEKVDKKDGIHFYGDYLYIKETDEIYLSKSLEDKLFEGFDTATTEAQADYHFKYNALLDSIRAKHSFINGVDYILTASSKPNTKKVTLIDTNIGRIKDSSKYMGNMQYAVEAKELITSKMNNQPYDIEFTKINKTKAMITYPDFLKLYEKVSGMTGTSDKEEFVELYGLETYEVETRKPVLRKDNEDELYVSKKSKYIAIIKEVRRCHKKGQPILIGTISIKESEEIARWLKVNKLPFQLINAKVNKNDENRMIARAGQKGMITIATNMAGRGTDIKLGSGVKDLEEGYKGLYVIGTSKNISERIDRQLKGRAGRQGDPGKSKHFVSLEDDYIKAYYGPRIEGIKKLYANVTDGRITNKKLIKAMAKAQSIIDSRNKQYRRYEEKWNKVLNEHRSIIYDMRSKILDSNPYQMLDIVREKMIPKYIDFLVKYKALDEINYELGHLIDVKSCYSTKENEFNKNLNDKLYTELKNKIIGKKGQDALNYTESLKIKMLRTIDDYWNSEIERLDELRKEESIAFVGEDPFKRFEYKANIEFAKELMPSLLNECITYAIRPEIPYGNYTIGEEKEKANNKDSKKI